MSRRTTHRDVSITARDTVRVTCAGGCTLVVLGTALLAMSAFIVRLL